MTNRIEYTDRTTEATVQDEVLLIAITLESRGRALTLENALEMLGQGLKNAPDEWKITLNDLPGLWAELIKGE